MAKGSKVSVESIERLCVRYATMLDNGVPGVDEEFVRAALDTFGDVVRAGSPRGKAVTDRVPELEDGMFALLADAYHGKPGSYAKSVRARPERKRKEAPSLATIGATEADLATFERLRSLDVDAVVARIEERANGTELCGCDAEDGYVCRDHRTARSAYRSGWNG